MFAHLSQDFSSEKSYLRFNYPSIFGAKRDITLINGDFSIVNVLHKTAISVF